MSREVSFRRASLLEIQVSELSEVARFEIELSKEIDPDSGMTLNLLDVDLLFAKLQKHMSAQTGSSVTAVTEIAAAFVAGELSTYGAQLQRLEVVFYPSASAHVWLSQFPEMKWVRSQKPMRVRIKDNGMLAGPVRILEPFPSNQNSNDFAHQSEMQVSHESEILQELESRFPQALEISFQDMKTGDIWSSRK